MTAHVIDIRTRQPRRVESLTDAVAEALRAAEYQRAVEDGYIPRIIPIPRQKLTTWGGYDPKGAA